jgi:hypothetical protein
MPKLLIATTLFLITSIAPAQHRHQDHSTAHETHKADSPIRKPTITAAVKPTTPLVIDQPVSMTLTLTDSSHHPVAFDDLREIHTKRVHLLIVDPSLSDYQHEHPTPTGKPGEYAFQFTPRHGGEYFFYADLLPEKTNAQEYSLAHLKVPGQPAAVQKNENRTVTVDGYHFELAFDNPQLTQGKGTRATLKVSTSDGKPMDKLEPLMGAFAHLVAFTEDRKHVLHVHPQGKEPETESERGGPELSFYVNPASPGYQQLYAQVQINGENVFAPFGLNVAERKVPGDTAGIFAEAQSNLEQMQNAVDLGQLEQVHGIAFWTRDVLHGLENAADAPAAKNQEIAGDLKQIDRLAQQLDQAGDSHNAQNAKQLAQEFGSTVASLRTKLGLTAGGAGEAAAAGGDKTTSGTAGDSSSSGTVKLIGNKNCPVSNMPVGSMEPGAAIVYKGYKIGLCCSGCKATFNKDPETYLKKAQQQATAK